MMTLIVFGAISASAVGLVVVFVFLTLRRARRRKEPNGVSRTSEPGPKPKRRRLESEFVSEQLQAKRVRLRWFQYRLWHLFVLTGVPDLGVEGITSVAFLRLTDDRLEPLEGFTNLQSLSLFQTRVADAELEHLKGLILLGELYLNGTQVSDNGTQVSDNGTQVSDASRLRGFSLFGLSLTVRAK